jgi:hypothetical protein
MSQNLSVLSKPTEPVFIEEVPTPSRYSPVLKKTTLKNYHKNFLEIKLEPKKKAPKKPKESKEDLL